MNLKTVFMGSPEIAVHILQDLVNHYPVCGVVTQPDRPAGRGNTIVSPPVKILADELGIPTFQPERLRTPEAFAQLAAWEPDLIVVAAYGQILRQNVLNLPKFGCINVHASYLPRWRGAAPIQAAILNGDETSGVTIMRMDAGIDTGPILSQQIVALDPQETLATLTQKLAEVGGRLLVDTLDDYLSGKITFRAQNEIGATYAPMLSKADGRLDFERSGVEIDRKVRALNDWPGTFTDLEGVNLKIRKVEFRTEKRVVPGSRAVFERFPAIGTSDGWIVLKEVQPAGKKWMSGADFLRGTLQWKTGK